MSTALYRKWRSQNFDEVIGQEHVTQTLRNALRDHRVAHAYLFAGPRGTGKTSLARILAKALNCTAPEAERPCGKCSICVAITEGRMLDLIEIDAASNNSVDDIRELRDKVGFRPSEGRYKVYVIDECFRYEDTVTLDDGSKMAIGRIVEQQLPVKVLSYNESTGTLESKEITHYSRKAPVVPMVKITFDNNRRVVCTINHKFYTPKGQVCAGHLTEGQFVYTNDNQQCAGLAVSVVKGIESCESPEFVYNIEVADNHNYFVRDILVANCHMLSVSAFNALLKTLEEPPPHTRFILATTEPHKIPATILSRCQRFDFRRIPVPEIAGHLRHIVHEEGFSAEDEALTAIARAAQGCMRDAVSLLDQMFSYGHDTVTFAQVQNVLGAVSAQAVVDFVSALAKRDIASGLGLIQQLVTQGASLVEFCHQILEHLRGVMVIQLTGNAALLADLPGETVRQMQAQAQQMAHPMTVFAIKRFSESVNELKGGFQPQLPLEMAMIEVVQSVPMQSGVVNSGTVNSGAVGQSPITGPPLATEVKVEESAAKVGAATIAQTLDANAVRKLRASWGEIKNTAKAQLGLQVIAALNSVRDMAVGEQSVALAFGNNQFSHDIIAKPETLSKVAAIISNSVGRPIQLECQMGDSAKLSNVFRIESEKKSDGSDPLLEFAVSTLGATVVE